MTFFGGGDDGDFGGYDSYEDQIWWTDPNTGVQYEVEDWWYQTMTLPGINDQGPVMTTLTMQEWHYEMRSQDVESFYNKYGMGQYDIIRMLEREELWTAEDWKIFHDNYEG